MTVADRETGDRLLGLVNVHPGFRLGGSGLQAGRKGEN